MLLTPYPPYYFIDNVNCPSRLWGSTQFAGGLSFITGYNASALQRFVPFVQYFPDSWSVPFFQTPWIVNPLDTDQIAISVNGTENSATGIWVFQVPDDIMSPAYAPNVTAIYAQITALQRSECLERLHAAGIPNQEAISIANRAASDRLSRDHGTGISFSSYPLALIPSYPRHTLITLVLTLDQPIT